jgi:UDP-N-acetylmuramate--alanine ligase
MKQKAYFVGAGGIGMAALERYCLSKGMEVGGYDRTPTELTDHLIAEGADIAFDDSAEAIPERFRDPSDTLVVYTPAVPDSHAGLQWFRKNGFEVVKRSRLLGDITRTSRGICFAGTHGKTTTSSMAAYILHSTPGVGCNAFLGGVLRNYDSNFLLSATSPWTVIEADEFDRSFHTLSPWIAVVTATDPDHLDIYGTEEAYLESFAHFTSLIRPGGFLVMHTGLKMAPRVADGVTVYTYGTDENAQFRAVNIRHDYGKVIFDICFPDGSVIRDFAPGVPVEVNIDNTVAAVAACWLTGEMDADIARGAMASYMGPKRRFELRWEENIPGGRVIVDDYAHHPEELRASILSMRKLYPGRKLSVAFQPHLYSRTRDFAPQFAEALSLADEVVMISLYPAREEPIPGISSKTILDLISGPEKLLIDKEDFAKTIKKRNFEILLTAGAGDLPDYIPALIKEL